MRALCQACGEHGVNDDDFVCQFCFGRLPSTYKRKLRLARGRAEEPKKKEEALDWLRKTPRRTSGSQP